MWLEGWSHAAVKPYGADDGHGGDYSEDDVDDEGANFIRGRGRAQDGSGNFRCYGTDDCHDEELEDAEPRQLYSDH